MRTRRRGTIVQWTVLVWSVVGGLAHGGAMFGPANILPLKCEGSTDAYRLVKGTVPGFLYLPGERVDLTFTFKKGDDAGTVKDFAIEIQGVHTRKPNKTKQYIDPFGYPDVLNLDGAPIRRPLEVAFGEQPETTFTVEGLPVPERYGTYVLILTRGERRILLGSLARVMKAREDGTVDNTPIFGEDNDPKGVCVMLGQLLTRGGPTPQDNPKGRLWAQVDQVDGGTITIENADGALRFHDVAGNELYKGQKTVRIDLDILPTYILSNRGPGLVAERVRQGRTEGKYPAEILPHDFTQPITGRGLVLNVEVANRLNRAIEGILSAKAPDGFSIAGNGRKVALEAGGKKNVAFRFTQVKADASNQYPFEFTFASDAGKCAYREVLNCAVAVKGARRIDGDLSDWQDVPGITLVGKQEGIQPDELARKPWLRLIRDLPKDALIAELKMAWDEENVYVAARVSDAAPQVNKVRMQGRDEHSYFHSSESDNEKPWKSWLAESAPGHSFAEVPYIYKKKPFDGAYDGDQLQLALNATDGYHDLQPVTDVPWGFHAVPDTDYEFCAYRCADGGSELWNYLAPGIPRIHDWPHQPKGKATTNPTPGARHVVKQDGNVRIYEIAIPRDRIADLKLQAGTTFKFSFFVGNNGGPKIFYGEGKAVTKMNGLTLHPYWWTSPSCDVEWALVE